LFLPLLARILWVEEQPLGACLGGQFAANPTHRGKPCGFEGLSSEEISARMTITPNAARCHLMRGRKQLRKLASAPRRDEIELDEPVLASVG
jgi:hypothetical protein